MRRSIARGLVAVTLTCLTIVTTAALALSDESVDDGPLGDGTEAAQSEWDVGGAGPMGYAFDANKGVLILDLRKAEAEDGAEGDESNSTCLPTDSPSADPADGDAEGVGEDGLDPDQSTRPDHCLEIDVTGPNGQINHGSVVSNTVHALKEHRDYLDGPLGHYVREIARSDLGKSNQRGADGDEVDGEDGDEAKDRKHHDDPNGASSKEKGQGGPPDHANAGGKGGPPDHANSGGNGSRGGKK